MAFEEHFEGEGYLKEHDFETVLISKPDSSDKSHRLPPGGHQSPDCPYQTRQSSNFKKHRIIHTGEKPYACGECSYKTNRKGHLFRHKLTHEKSLLGTKRPVKLPKLHQCPECMYQTMNSSYIKTHIKRHTVNLQCQECPYQAESIYKLKQHRRNHTVKSRHCCSECSFKSAHKKVLVKHKLIHFRDGEKQYSCNECSYKTTHEVNLKDHMFSHSTEDPKKKLHSCNACSFETLKKTTLRDHKSAHWLKQFCSSCSIETMVFQKSVPAQQCKEVSYVCDVCSGDKKWCLLLIPLSCPKFLISNLFLNSLKAI